MQKKYIVLTVGLILILAFIFVFLHDNSSGNISKEIESKHVKPVEEKVVDFEKYNIDYMNDNVKGILTKRMGNEKTDFYLPSTGYVNVSRGSKYGVAFVIQNINPKIPEGNEFSYNFSVDSDSVGDCGVNLEVAQSWIERGWASSGVIGGQWREDWNEWYDAMTVYFSFPKNINPCNIKYNFEITKDGLAYDSRVLEFNLV